MDVCTIIAKNYLAHARVLARSFARHHPDGQFTVLVIDELAGYLDPATEPFDILTPRDIGCEPFRAMACRYNVLELSTAVKPWLLRHLLERGSGAITYLDPDIEVFGSLERLDQLAREHDLVLTPHNTEPIPDDGERPTQIDILIAGVYNLGYVSLGRGAQSDRLLDWWSDRLQRDCRVDPVYGYFVDQRWFDLAPGLVSEYAIVREPEFNVAYWNLHSRPLAHGEGSGYSVAGRPLRFFHFSGFDPREPALLSRHQTRIRLSERPEAGRICREYAAAVLAEGYEESSTWPYSFDRLANGQRFTPLLRRLWVEREHVDGEGETPFEEDGCRGFMRWLAEEVDDRPPGINRLLAGLYNRADVRAEFPRLADGDLPRFLEWAATADDPDLELPPDLRPAPGASHGPPAPGVDPWGVNVVGYFRSELGVGEAARQVISALDAAQVPVLPIHGRTIPPNRQGHPFSQLQTGDAAFPVNLICMNADVLSEFAGQAGERFFRDRHSIGLWFWETNTFPERWLGAFDVLQEVWLPTDHVSRAVGAVSPIPTVTVRIPVSLPAVRPMSRAALGLPAGFLFLFSFDLHSVFERKNPLDLVAAFARTFAPGEGASLVIKTINETSDRANYERLRVAAAAHPDVHLRTGYLSAAEKDSMTAACDCYVSLHRSEGFGLTMAEAMFLGRPVIATAYSGNLDFMTTANSLLVAHDLVSIGRDAAPYPPDGRWAQPDLEHAGQLMRQVFDDREAAADLGRRAALDIRRTHSPHVAGQIMAERLARIRRHLEPPAAAVVPPPAAMPALAAHLARGPRPGGRTALGPVGAVARRAALRLMKPYTAHQDSINQEIMRSLEGLVQQRSDVERELRARDGAAARVQAEMLAQVRHRDRVAAAQDGAHTAALAELHEISAAHLQRLEDVERLTRESLGQEQAIPHMEGVPFVPMRHRLVGGVQGYCQQGKPSEATYRSFEDLFRGSESFIRDRQRVYLALLEGRSPVLDLGCGRGEFLDLLREEGIDRLGVDVDPGMVERCHRKGHDEVVLGDGLDYLEQLPDESLGVLFCAQVIEHLPVAALARLLSLARRKLQPEGMLIAETVNPHSRAALKTFWVDLTHQHPIFPEVALELCREAGFPAAFVFHPEGGGDVERDRFTTGEYAVLAGPLSLLGTAPPPEAAGVASPRPQAQAGSPADPARATEQRSARS